MTHSCRLPVPAPSAWDKTTWPEVHSSSALKSDFKLQFIGRDKCGAILRSETLLKSATAWTRITSPSWASIYDFSCKQINRNREGNLMAGRSLE